MRSYEDYQELQEISHEIDRAREKTRLLNEEEQKRDMERPMYCCVTFSRAVSYNIIIIDNYHNLIKFNIKDEIKEKGSYYIRICPYCGVNLYSIINFAQQNMKDGLL